jgi:hypothetical protein
VEPPAALLTRAVARWSSWATVALLAALAVRLARLDVDVPQQDLSISLRRIPARPASGVVLRVRKRPT